ncbi:MAG: hypothetical protein QOJ34_799, partial [Pseudonocardiales bacterium]|nr:hypothetical protein [Pseudonocardiales bacterium]
MMPRRRALVAMAALAAEAVAVIVAAPAARAADPNGFAPSILTKTFTVAAGQRADGISVLCPAGTTPIAGGLRTDPATTVHYKDYINWGTGKGFAAAVDNPTDSDVAGTAYVRCVDAAWLTATSRVVATFAENNSTHHTGGYTRCPSGSYALSARVDWNSTIGKQSIDYSGPTWDMRSWVVAGTNAGTGNYMFVDVQCVSTSSLPGAYL